MLFRSHRRQTEPRQGLAPGAGILNDAAVDGVGLRAGNAVFLGESHPAYATSLHNLATVYRQLGQLAVQTVYGDRQLDDAEQVWGHWAAKKVADYLGRQGAGQDWIGAWLADVARRGKEAKPESGRIETQKTELG